MTIGECRAFAACLCREILHFQIQGDPHRVELREVRLEQILSSAQDQHGPEFLEELLISCADILAPSLEVA